MTTTEMIIMFFIGFWLGYLFREFKTGKAEVKQGNTAWFCFMKIPNEVKP